VLVIGMLLAAVISDSANVTGPSLSSPAAPRAWPKSIDGTPDDRCLIKDPRSRARAPAARTLRCWVCCRRVSTELLLPNGAERCCCLPSITQRLKGKGVSCLPTCQRCLFLGSEKTMPVGGVDGYLTWRVSLVLLGDFTKSQTRSLHHAATILTYTLELCLYLCVSGLAHPISYQHQTGDSVEHNTPLTATGASRALLL
jgi:hypothetical protein